MKKYIVGDRHILFYPANTEVTEEQLKQFYTEKAISEFLKYGYLKPC